LAIVVATISALGVSVSICLASKVYGFDRHVWDLPLSVGTQGRKIAMLIEALYLFSTGVIKISILLFYRRLVPSSVSPAFAWATRAIIASVVAYIIAFEAILLFGCRPINAFWNQVDPAWKKANKYQCPDELSVLFAANTTSIVQDFLAFLMPLLLFRKLQLPFRQKIILQAIFGIGFFLCIVGIIRLIYTVNLYSNTYDLTWNAEPIWAWTAVELHGALICGSAPALRVFFKKYLEISNTGNTPGRYLFQKSDKWTGIKGTERV